MKLTLVRLVATLMLTGQVLPVGLPLLCDQVQRTIPTDCDQQMASRPSGPVVDVATHASPCVNSALCATVASAVVAFGGPHGVSGSESHLVAFDVATLVPTDPHAPLSPPPQA